VEGNIPEREFPADNSQWALICGTEVLIVPCSEENMRYIK
jgi:hypothetical protein